VSLVVEMEEVITLGQHILPAHSLSMGSNALDGFDELAELSRQGVGRMLSEKEQEITTLIEDKGGGVSEATE